MTRRLRQLLARYINTWWLPAPVCLAVAVACGVAVALMRNAIALDRIPHWRPLAALPHLLLASLVVTLIGIPTAALWAFIQKRWVRGAVNLVAFPLCGCMTLLVMLGLTGAGTAWVLAVNDPAFHQEGPLKTDASNLTRTIVTPHLEAPISNGANVLWCGTFQLAWNEARTLIGEDLHFSNEPPMVGVLNSPAFTSRDIDDESCVAVAGFVRDDIHGRITQQLKDKFGGKATPRYALPDGIASRPQDIVTYSYLFKNLEFPVPFERIAEPTAFGAEKVMCFGIGDEYRHPHLKMLEQLAILSYESDDDFIVEIKTKSTQDRLILAKVQPHATLAATIQAVLKRAAHSVPIRLQVGDVLKVPKFSFDITRRYGELEGLALLPTNPAVAKDLVIVSAIQNIRFQCDEKGVRLHSEGRTGLGCCAPPPPQRIMVFDKPFLIALQRREAKVPYFALWVGNPDLLVKVESTPTTP